MSKASSSIPAAEEKVLVQVADAWVRVYTGAYRQLLTSGEANDQNNPRHNLGHDTCKEVAALVLVQMMEAHYSDKG